MSIPHQEARPIIKCVFMIDGIDQKDYGYLFSRLEFQATLNGGYIVRCQLGDNKLNLINQLKKRGYLDNARRQPLPVKFQLKASKNAQYPEAATREQIAIVISSNAYGGPANHSYFEFVAIDPASWFLNTGDASGKSYKGRVSSVIQQVIDKYAPSIKLDISKTIDSDQNRYWMMRQDPKTFISSLQDWSSSVTRGKTHWIFSMDDYNLTIKEQAEISSKQRAFYRFWKGQNDTIISWDILADNALSVVQTKLVTQGLSSISGQYLDIITDNKEQKVFVKDTTTPNKIIAKTTKEGSFAKPDDSIGSGESNDTRPIGWSAIPSIPEIYSAGDLGISYEDYIDGRPRSIWLNLMKNVLQLKLTVIGHGEWSNSIGLGSDTVFLKWLTEPDEDGNQLYFCNGNWLVNGFYHTITRREWTTDLYLARFDHDSNANKVGS